MRFSQRHGHVAVRSAIQLEGLDDAARTEIWNMIYSLIFDGSERYQIDYLFRPIWAFTFERDADDYENIYIDRHVKNLVKVGAWYEVYDLIEAIYPHHDSFAEYINRVLESVRSGYRVVDGKVAPISTDEEIAEVERAIATDHSGVSHHFTRALELFADREAPDYANSIKESVSAVESKTRDLTGKTTLGAALDEIKKAGIFTHPALIDGWKKIYGWVSDSDGVRHGGEQVPAVDQNLARYMLVTCSAFVNLLSGAQNTGEETESQH
jgi:hypothetical protein